MYAIFHIYETEVGNCGDVEKRYDLIGLVSTEQEARHYCIVHENERKYDNGDSYLKLKCGSLGFCDVYELNPNRPPYPEWNNENFKPRGMRIWTKF